MEKSYYDLDDILAGEELVPVSWSTDQKELGHLAKKGGDSLVCALNLETCCFYSLSNLAQKKYYCHATALGSRKSSPIS